MAQTYTITRLEEWSDSLWDQIIDAVEETVVSVSLNAEEDE